MILKGKLTTPLLSESRLQKKDKSEKAQDNHGFRFNQQKLFKGEVTIFQTKQSGDNLIIRLIELEVDYKVVKARQLLKSIKERLV